MNIDNTRVLPANTVATCTGPPRDAPTPNTDTSAVNNPPTPANEFAIVQVSEVEDDVVTEQVAVPRPAPPRLTVFSVAVEEKLVPVITRLAALFAIGAAFGAIVGAARTSVRYEIEDSTNKRRSETYLPAP